MVDERYVQDKHEDKGFTLPPPSGSGKQTATPERGSTSQVTTTQVPRDIGPNVDTSSRDLVVGVAILAVFIVAFFLAKNAYANGLVGKRISPGRANASGWWLFILLTSLSAAVVLTAVNADKYMNPYILGPMGIVALISLIAMIKTSRH